MRALSLLIVTLFLFACSSKEDAYLKPISLLEYGVPLTILAPDSIDVKKEKFFNTFLLTLENPKIEDYNIQVSYSQASNDQASIKAQQLEVLKTTFPKVEVLLDEAEGFVYKTTIDETLESYGFRRIILMGDKEYIFQSGSGIFTKEQAEEMYHATVPQDMGKK